MANEHIWRVIAMRKKRDILASETVDRMWRIERMVEELKLAASPENERRINEILDCTKAITVFVEEYR